MKTTKLILSILGVALATLSFGQLISHPEISKPSDLDMASFIEPKDGVLFYNAEYNEENGITMHWVNQRPGINYRTVSSSDHSAPLISRTYFARDMGVRYETSPVLEEWMTIPFGNGLEESELWVEYWMTTPFESDIYDEAIEIEPWMTANWMTADWN